MIGQGLVFLILALVFSLGGYLVRHGVGVQLIPGYRSLKPDDKAKRDSEAMSRFTGLVLYFFAASWIVAAFGAFLQLLWLSLVGVGLFLIVAVVSLIGIRVHGQFRI